MEGCWISLIDGNLVAFCVDREEQKVEEEGLEECQVLLIVNDLVVSSD